jgi:Flp pilus assembly protein TadG
MTRLNAYRRDQRGSSAAEFALVLPVFLALVLGVIHMSLVVYSAVELHDATEWTARCLSVSANNPAGATTTCPDSTKVQTYATGRYTGPKISPTFSVVTTTSCTNGKQVSGSGSYSMSLGLMRATIPISAKACFPYSPATS